MTMSHNMVLLTFLYFIQGLPYGLQTRFLPVYLRAQTGASLNRVALFRLLHTPWLCKALWAPAVDRYGSKRLWLLWSIAGLAITCLATSMITPDNSFSLLCIAMAVMNVFTSTQDVAVDSVAVALLSKSELGNGNTAQVVGYKLGSIFGGGMLVWFLDTVGWTGLFLVLALLYVEGMMFVYLSPVLRKLNTHKSSLNTTTCNQTINAQDESRNVQTSQINENHYESSEDSDSEFRECLEEPSAVSSSEEKCDDHPATPSLSSKLHARKQLPRADNSTGQDGDEQSSDNESLSEKTSSDSKNEKKSATQLQPQYNYIENIYHATVVYVQDLLRVPGTQWMLIYVLLYKLGKCYYSEYVFPKI